jgi:hypothetical protein
MPIQRTPGGKYKWGSSGKEYSTRAQAARQARAIFASGYKKNNEGKKK